MCTKDASAWHALKLIWCIAYVFVGFLSVQCIICCLRSSWSIVVVGAVYLPVIASTRLGFVSVDGILGEDYGGHPSDCKTVS